MILVSTELARTLCRLFYRGASTFSVAIVVWSAALDLLPAITFLGLAIIGDGLRYALEKRRAIALPLGVGAFDADTSRTWRVTPVTPRSVAILLLVMFGGLYLVHFINADLVGAFSDALRERYAAMKVNSDPESAHNAYLVESFGLSLALALLLYFPMSATIRKPSMERLGDALYVTRTLEWKTQLRFLMMIIVVLFALFILKVANSEPYPLTTYLDFAFVMAGPLNLRLWLEFCAFLELKELTHN